MKVIGITGNIGSGKSVVSNYLKEKKCFIIDADKIGHNILLRDGLAYDEVVNYFGNEIVGTDNDKNIDRKILGQIVFNDKQKLQILNNITHKHIIKKIKGLIIERKRLNYDDYIIIDAALLVEANLHEICDIVIVVVSDLEKRIGRIIKRDNITKENALKKIQSQKTNEQLIKYGNFVIENNSDLTTLYEQIEKILKKIESR